MELSGRPALGVARPKLGRARGVGRLRGALGVPCGVDAERVGEGLSVRVPSSRAVTPTYLLARDPAVTVLSRLVVSRVGFLRVFAWGVTIERGAGAWDGVVRPDIEGVTRPPWDEAMDATETGRAPLRPVDAAESLFGRVKTPHLGAHVK